MKRIQFLQLMMAVVLAPFGLLKKKHIVEATATVTGLPLADAPIQPPKIKGLLCIGYCDGTFTFKDMATDKIIKIK